jgi:hypothetical protein
VREGLNFGIVFRWILVFKGRAVTQDVSRQPLTLDIHFRYQANSCQICGRKFGTETGFSPSTSILLMSLSLWAGIAQSV